MYIEKPYLKSTQLDLTTSNHHAPRHWDCYPNRTPSAEEFRKEPVARLKNIENWDDIPNEALFLSCVATLTCAITEMIEVCIPKCKSAPYQKHWWSQELTDRCREVHRLARRAYSRQMEPGDPSHTAHKEARRHYATMIENAKKQHWDSFLTSLDEKYIWTAHC